MNATPAAALLLALLPVFVQEDEVVSQDLLVGGDKNKRYFFIGPQKKGAEPPKPGYKLAVILPGGSGSAEFHTFVKSIWSSCLSGEYLLVQPVSVKWKEDQVIVWPTKRSPVPGMKFTTEDFVEEVIREVAAKHKIDPRHIFTLTWSSSGMTAYTLSLLEKRLVTGSFISMSIFKEEDLPPLRGAKGHAYYLHHSPEDQKCPVDQARKARDELKKQGAKVEYKEYEGGHGWPKEVKDRYDQIRAGFQWLEKATSR